MAYVAIAVEQDDASMLFRVIDQRARHAMISIVLDRRAAADLIRETYPAQERDVALRALGDAATVDDAAGLFAARCDGACRRELGRSVGAPTSTSQQGDETVVQTSRGATLRMYRSDEQAWWGLVWNTQDLDHERNRANQALRQIERNAETYRRRTELEN